MSPIGIKMNAADQLFYEQFYVENRKLIYYFALKFSKTPSDCDDLVQDTVLRLTEYIPQLRRVYTNKHKLASYLYQTVQSVFVDQLRKGEQEILLARDDIDIETCEGPMGNSHAMLLDLSNKLDAELLKAELPKKDWLLLSRAYILGYTTQELGFIYGSSASAIRMALSRVRRKAKKILMENGRMRSGSNEQ